LHTRYISVGSYFSCAYYRCQLTRLDRMAATEHARPAHVEVWRALAELHAEVHGALETALQAEHGLSVVEHAVLDALSRQDGWHLRMHELSRATALSASATTRLVNRLEARGLIARVLCADDRRGIYSELTQDGWALLRAAAPTHDRIVEELLARAARSPALAPLVAALERLPDVAARSAADG
jgi:DNA-binding MarR family transcriptional regulator